jgi:hypothetical protein
MQAGDALLLRRTLTAGGGGLQEVRLAGPVRLRALRLDPPGRDGENGGDGVTGAAAAAAAAASVSITVFARDLESPLASRFACVGAGLGLPPAGARAFELTVSWQAEERERAGSLPHALFLSPTPPPPPPTPPALHLRLSLLFAHSPS